MFLISSVVRWSRAHWSMLSNASSLVGTVGINAGLGFIFWWFAAKRMPATEVGLASAAVSAMQLLGTLSMLGLGTLLIGQLANRTMPRGALIFTSLLLATSVGCVVGLGFALVAGHLSPELAALTARPIDSVVFALGVGLTAATLVLDQALIGLLWGGLQLWRNMIFAGGKLMLLVCVSLWAGEQTGMAIYTSWLLGNLLSLMVTAASIALMKRQRIVHRPQLHLLRGLARSAFDHHTLNLALQAPGLVLPLLVTVFLSAEMNAHFYIAWMIASFAFVAPFALSVALFAVTSADPTALGPKLRMSIGLSFVVGVAANIVLWLGSSLVLGVFGKAYVEQAGFVLQLLGLGVFGIIVKDHFVAIYRARGNVADARGAIIIGTLIEIGLPILGARAGGLLGFTLGWLAALAVQSMYMAPLVFRVASGSVSMRRRTDSVQA